MSPAILIVNGDADERRRIQVLLEEFQDTWKLYLTDSGRNALSILETVEIDVIVVDAKLPEMSGLELATEIRRREYWKNLPIVLQCDRNDDETKSRAHEAGITDTLDKPIQRSDLLSRIRTMIRLKFTQDRLREQSATLEQALESQIVQLEQSQFEIVFRLSKAAEVHDIETGNHTLRVGFSAQLMALTMGMPRDFQTKIVLAAPLHDIGKLGVPDSILRKEGPLTETERGIMQQHCVMGHRMLTESYRLPRCFELDLTTGPVPSSPFIEMASHIALQHHERWDGTGYPSGIRAEDIDIAARIVAIADVYDALRTKRSYKPSFSQEKSIEILRRDSGTHFDPLVVEAFLDCLPIINRINDELADPFDWSAQAA